MELLKKKNQATNFIFPLVSSGSNEYFSTSAWANMTNASVSAYSWSDALSATILPLSQQPIQIAATGIWSLSATANEMNPSNHDHILIKIEAGEIQDQALLVLLTDYATQNLADVNNKVVASVIPQVTVSANLDKTGYSGIVTNEVSVSAYTNFPQVYISGISNDVVTTIQSGLATSTQLTSVQTTLYNAISALDLLTEAEVRTILGLNTSSTINEVSALPVNPSIAEALMLDYMQRRNKQVTNGTTFKVETYNDAGTKVFEGDITDDGSIFTKSKLT